MRDVLKVMVEIIPWLFCTTRIKPAFTYKLSRSDWLEQEWSQSAAETTSRTDIRCFKNLKKAILSVVLYKVSILSKIFSQKM